MYQHFSAFLNRIVYEIACTVGLHMADRQPDLVIELEERVEGMTTCKRSTHAGNSLIKF